MKEAVISRSRRRVSAKGAIKIRSANSTNSGARSRTTDKSNLDISDPDTDSTSTTSGPPIEPCPFGSVSDQSLLRYTEPPCECVTCRLSSTRRPCTANTFLSGWSCESARLEKEQISRECEKKNPFNGSGFLERTGSTINSNNFEGTLRRYSVPSYPSRATGTAVNGFGREATTVSGENYKFRYCRDMSAYMRRYRDHNTVGNVGGMTGRTLEDVEEIDPYLRRFRACGDLMERLQRLSVMAAEMKQSLRSKTLSEASLTLQYSQLYRDHEKQVTIATAPVSQITPGTTSSKPPPTNESQELPVQPKPPKTSSDVQNIRRVVQPSTCVTVLDISDFKTNSMHPSQQHLLAVKPHEDENKENKISALSEDKLRSSSKLNFDEIRDLKQRPSSAPSTFPKPNSTESNGSIESIPQTWCPPKVLSSSPGSNSLSLYPREWRTQLLIERSSAAVRSRPTTPRPHHARVPGQLQGAKFSTTKLDLAEIRSRLAASGDTGRPSSSSQGQGLGAQALFVAAPVHCVKLSLPSTGAVGALPLKVLTKYCHLGPHKGRSTTFKVGPPTSETKYAFGTTVPTTSERRYSNSDVLKSLDRYFGPSIDGSAASVLQLLPFRPKGKNFGSSAS